MGNIIGIDLLYHYLVYCRNRSIRILSGVLLASIYFDNIWDTVYYGNILGYYRSIMEILIYYLI